MPKVVVYGVIKVPPEQVFAFWADYGAGRRRQAFPGLLAQRVMERQGDTGVVANTFSVGGQPMEDRRRFTIYPKEHVIEEEMLESPVMEGKIAYRFQTDPEGTMVTVEQEVRMKGAGFFAQGKVRRLLEDAGREAIENVRKYLEKEKGNE